MIQSFFELMATIGEVLFGILLIVGDKVKLAAYGSFALTLIFALSMLLFIGYRPPFDYSVFVVSFSSLLLASVSDKQMQRDQSNVRSKLMLRGIRSIK